jgi:hypothetical protein
MDLHQVSIKHKYHNMPLMGNKFVRVLFGCCVEEFIKIKKL